MGRNFPAFISLMILLKVMPAIAICKTTKKPLHDIYICRIMFKNLIPLSLPQPDMRMAKKGEDIMVWDEIRKKYLKLTPEEWVRQHFVHYLMQRDYPKTCIALEGGFRLNQKLQRTDIMIYKNASPVLIVECKAPQVKINQKTMDQASRYNLHYKVDYLILTNGLEHFAAKVDFEQQKYILLKDIPSFHDL